MNKRVSNVEGFISKRSGEKGRNLSDQQGRKQLTEIGGQVVKTDLIKDNLKQSDIDESFKNIDEIAEPKKKLTRRQKRLERRNLRIKKTHKKRRIVKWIILGFVVIILAIAGFFGYKLWSASQSSLTGNILNVFCGQKLKEDDNGRSNFLIFGTSEDDPGHEAPNLTDSIMVVSVDQTNKDMIMFSIPRDLEVEYGRPCVSGYRGKINAFYQCVNEEETLEAEKERLEEMRLLVSDMLDLDVQYSVHVNYTVLKDVINAIGGTIPINIESSDPRGYLDSQLDYVCGDSYDDRIKNCPPRGHYVDYPNGMATLNADQALNLARARGDSEPTYGFADSNFEREKNQRKILMAIREKAFSSGTLTNFSAISKLIDALGDNLRTNIEIGEVTTLAHVFSELNNSNIKSLDLLGDHILAGSGNPSAGTYNYIEWQEYLKVKLSRNPITREGASLVVLNGTKEAGLAETKASDLEDLGFVVAGVDNAPEGEYKTVEIYQLSSENTLATAKKLKELYSVDISTDKPPVIVDSSVKFVVIFGGIES